MMGEHRALVRLEVIADRVEPATEIMNAEPPTLLQVGGANWREADWARLIPDLDHFQRLDLDFGDVRGRASA